MNKTLLLPLLSLLPTTLAGCLSEDAVILGETEQAISESMGTPAVAPVGGFEMRNDRIYYVGYDGSAYRAYELDANLAVIRTSPAVASSELPTVENLTTDGTHVLFGNGSGNTRMSLAGASTQWFDPWGVFNKSLRGIGGVTLRDGTLTRIISGNGFGIGTYSPTEVFSAAQPAATPVMSESARAYLAPAGSYLRLVNLPLWGSPSTSLHCKLPTSTDSYAKTKSLATAHDEPKGNFRVAAKLLDGRLVECKRTPTSTSVKVIPLPFTVGDLALEGGGGVGFDSTSGVGIWVTSASTPELAYVTTTGKVLVYSLDGGKTSITPIPIPRVVRSFSDGSAAVLMSDGKFIRVTRM